MMILHAKNGTVELSDITIRALKRAWPTKDVDAALDRMHLYLLKVKERNPEKLPVYFWVFTRNWMRKEPDVIAPAAPQHAGWWRSEAATLEVGKWVGIAPRAGEEMPQYRERIREAIARQRAN